METLAIKHHTKHNNTTHFTLKVSRQPTLAAKVYTYLNMMEVGEIVSYDDIILEIYGEINASTKHRCSVEMSRAMRCLMRKKFSRRRKKRTIERLL